jgi:hypothetical protein
MILEGRRSVFSYGLMANETLFIDQRIEMRPGTKPPDTRF